MNSPKVTVLMSVYNGGDYLAEAIQSILSQSFTDFDFLIIDDGSTEPPDPIIDRFHDSRIIKIQQANMGLTRSLNKGLRMARGRYVARMDADDISIPSRLEAQVREMDTDPGLDLVGTLFDVMDSNKGLIETKELILDPVYRLWRLQFHNNYGHGTMMLRKQAIFDAGMYDERLKYAQDFDLWSRVSRKDNTKIVPAVLYRYRMVKQSGQASVRYYDDQLAAAIAISDNSLRACNPRLSQTDCAEVRALYWEFQLKGVSVRGLSVLPETFEGFCLRYVIDGQAKERMTRRVALDVLGEIKKSDRMSLTDQGDMIRRFMRWGAGLSQPVEFDWSS
jgi:glycosyltransferase involved in cell wall biosynthesis